jgi:hypothetical protein
MTTIAAVYAPDGFVIGADGRRTSSRDGSVATDTARKIYFAEAANVRVAYAWSGCVVTERIDSSFSFQTVSFKVASEMSSNRYKGLAEYIADFADRVYLRFAEWNCGVTVSAEAVNPYTQDFARLLMVGYVNGEPELADIEIRQESGVVFSPSIKTVLQEPKVFKILSGSIAVHDALCDADQMYTPKTLTDAVKLVSSYVQTCIDSKDTCEECRGTGGHLHLALVTPTATRWGIPPVTEEQANLLATGSRTPDQSQVRTSRE